eukprot:TRINITY_DN21730_c0_g1_i3.p1 TRINITY_DN21730_c0_g1~~TRINITY_DN21730_c0_g1_i3.p1  ORF type:complete len:167 (-),score=29.55 TRINITY_DN21730_c0_g1_i3:120-593(-)
MGLLGRALSRPDSFISLEDITKKGKFNQVTMTLDENGWNSTHGTKEMSVSDVLGGNHAHQELLQIVETTLRKIDDMQASLRAANDQFLTAVTLTHACDVDPFSLVLAEQVFQVRAVRTAGSGVAREEGEVAGLRGHARNSRRCRVRSAGRIFLNAAI